MTKEVKKYLTVLISVAVLFSNSSIATATPNQKSTLQAFSNEQVVGDNEIAAYIGTGGLLLPSSFSGSDKASVANCQGCVWAYTIFCLYDEEGLCQHSVGTCPVGQIRYRVWFGKTQSSAQVIGSVCWGSGRPPTRLDIERGIDDLVINYIPDLQITLIPPGKTLTSIPVLGWTNQPSNFKPPKFQLAGRIVEITAIPKWRWAWGDGEVEWKSVPGLAYPQVQISHTYRNVGTYLVGVTALWQATYSVAGIGTFDVGGDLLSQTDSVEITVAPAKSRLIKRS